MCTLMRLKSEKPRYNPGLTIGSQILLGAFLFLAGCTSPEPKPVDLYPEDMCAYCRMAVSDQRCASEIVTESREVYKFDDISCLEHFRSQQTGLRISAIFVKEYETRLWLPWGKAVIVETGIFTPMGSGKLAFTDSAHAHEFLIQNPVRK